MGAPVAPARLGPGASGLPIALPPPHGTGGADAEALCGRGARHAAFDGPDNAESEVVGEGGCHSDWAPGELDGGKDGPEQTGTSHHAIRSETALGVQAGQKLKEQSHYLRRAFLLNPMVGPGSTTFSLRLGITSSRVSRVVCRAVCPPNPAWSCQNGPLAQLTIPGSQSVPSGMTSRERTRLCPGQTESPPLRSMPTAYMYPRRETRSDIPEV